MAIMLDEQNIIHWGILSTAHINRRVIPAIRQSGRGHLLAVASRDPDKARDYAEQWHIPHAYGRYEDLLANSSIQAVYISLPNHLHTAWILKALDAGKHVLCEKPLCLSSDEMAEIKKKTIATGLYVMEGLMHLYHPQTTYWKFILDSGIIGDVHDLRSTFSFRLERPEDNYRWEAQRGGGVLWDIGVYPVSLYQYLLGQPATDVKTVLTFEKGVDVSATALLTYEANITGHFFVSFRSAYSTMTEIHGSKGILRITHPYNHIENGQAWTIVDDEIKELVVPREYLYLGEIEAMHDAIQMDKAPIIPLDFSRHVLGSLLAMRESEP